MAHIMEMENASIREEHSVDALPFCDAEFESLTRAVQCCLGEDKWERSLDEVLAYRRTFYPGSTNLDL